MTRSNHYSDCLTIQLPRAQGCKQPNTVDNGIEEVTEAARMYQFSASQVVKVLERFMTAYARFHTELDHYHVSQIVAGFWDCFETHSCSAILKGMISGLRILGRSGDDWML